MKENGAIIIDGQQVGHTVQCCHCGNHYQPRPGSGTRRGFCLKCMKPTCGSVGCAVCVPFEKKLDKWEKQHALD